MDDSPVSPPPADVTVVVMTRDRWPDLQRSLPHHEAPVVLVDNGSSDGTPALVRRHFPDVDVVELGHNHGAAARNVGVQRAATPFVAFADDDSWWAPGALGEAGQVLRGHPRLALLAGRVLVGDDGRPDPGEAAMAHSPLGTAPDLPGPSVLGFLACGAVVRRDAFLQVGGFDDVVFFMGEEERLALDLAARGWGLAWVDHVVAHHHPSPARDPQARQALLERNRLLTMVMRRPWPVALGEAAQALRSGPAGRRAVAQSLLRLPRALAARHRLPADIEQARRLLDHPYPWGYDRRVLTALRSWPGRRWLAALVAAPFLAFAYLRAAALPSGAAAPAAMPLWAALLGLAVVAGSLALASYLPARGWRPDLGCSPCAAASGLTLVGALVVLNGYGPDVSGPLLAALLTTFGLVQRLRQEPTCARV